jgi:hypothetical protein
MVLNSTLHPDPYITQYAPSLKDRLWERVATNTSMERPPVTPHRAAA